LIRKTGTMGTLHGEPSGNCVWIKAPGTLLRGSGGIAPENFEIVYAKSYNRWHFWVRKWFGQPSI